MQLPAIFFSDAMARAICWTLLHSLWQGILIAALAGLIIYATRKIPAAVRYNLLVADLLLFLLLTGMTFGYEMHRADAGSGPRPAHVAVAGGMTTAGGTASVVLTPDHPDLAQQINDYFNAHALVITMVWLTCLAVQLLRFSGGLYQLGRIRRNGAPAGGWSERVQVLAARSGIRRKIGLLETDGVQTPSAIGWWKPSILIPLGLLTNLPPDQVETILLHELAHIRRNDYVANLVLHLAEALFFFNPGFRWVAMLLRREREACCDDMVLAGTPDRNSYLEALVRFTQWVVDEKSASGREYAPQLGRKTDLLWRVRRMLNKENKKLQPMEKVILSFGLMALVLVSLLSMHPAPVHAGQVRAGQVGARQIGTGRNGAGQTGTGQAGPVQTCPVQALRTDPRPVLSSPSDTTPAPGRTGIRIKLLTVHSSTGDGHLKYHAEAIGDDGIQYEVTRWDDQVTEFRLNGELIPRADYQRYSAIIDSVESARKNIKAPVAPPKPAVPAVAATAAPTAAASVSAYSPAAPSAAPVPPAQLSGDSAPAPLAAPTPAPRPPATPGPHPAPAPHAPTPEDPMIYSNFQNPYAKHILLDLVKDGLAGDLNFVSFVLNKDEMIVNGVRQPDNIFKTYRDKYIGSPKDHMIYSQHFTEHSSGSHCECIHEPDIPAPAY